MLSYVWKAGNQLLRNCFHRKEFFQEFLFRKSSQRPPASVRLKFKIDKFNGTFRLAMVHVRVLLTNSARPTMTEIAKCVIPTQIGLILPSKITYRILKTALVLIPTSCVAAHHRLNPLTMAIASTLKLILTVRIH